VRNSDSISCQGATPFVIKTFINSKPSEVNADISLFRTSKGLDFKSIKKVS
jgi:hypothetical protein